MLDDDVPASTASNNCFLRGGVWHLLDTHQPTARAPLFQVIVAVFVEGRRTT